MNFGFKPKSVWTRLPSNLRETTCECVYLVRRTHFLSREKNGGHTNWSVIVENPMLHANSSCSRQNGSYCRSKFYTSCCDLDLDLMIFIYEQDPFSSRYTRWPKMKFLCRGFQKLSHYIQICTHTYIHTATQNITMSLHVWQQSSFKQNLCSAFRQTVFLISSL